MKLRSLFRRRTVYVLTFVLILAMIPGVVSALQHPEPPAYIVADFGKVPMCGAPAKTNVAGEPQIYLIDACEANTLLDLVSKSGLALTDILDAIQRHYKLIPAELHTGGNECMGFMVHPHLVNQYGNQVTIKGKKFNIYLLLWFISYEFKVDILQTQITFAQGGGNSLSYFIPVKQLGPNCPYV